MALIDRTIVGGLVAMLIMLAATPLAQARDTNQRECRDGRGKVVPCERLQQRREINSEERLSPEERRQLRRDIKDAGREIYQKRR